MNEQVARPNKTVQLCISRRLLHNCKQICDLSQTNSKVLSELNAGMEKSQRSYFTHPSCEDYIVLVSNDGLHLLKLTQGHFFVP
jgi:hypothetical protein